MKKRIKIILFIFLGCLFTLFSFNYIVFGNLNFGNFSRSFSFFTENTYTDLSYNYDFIEENQLITSDSANGAGTLVHNYRLELSKVPERILSFHLNMNSTVANASQIVIDFYTRDGIFSYNQDEFYVNNQDDKMILLHHEKVQKIVIEAIYEQYSSSELVNNEVLSLDKIEINKNTDIQILKVNLLKDFLCSVLVTLVLFIFILVLFKTKIDRRVFCRKIKIEKVFLILSIFWGIVFSVLFPLYQIPDELTHINMIYEEFNLDVKFQNINDSYGDTGRMIRNYDEKVDLNEYFDLSKKVEMSADFEIPNISFIRHFPQGIGLIICSFLNLPVFLTITVAEFLAVLFYAIVCYFALKLIPVKKEMMMLVMLLPMCIQQMGSFSYDVVLLSVCFLFISYVLYLKFVKEKIIISDLIKLFILLGIIAMVKIPYVILGGMLILLPLSKFDLNLKIVRIDGMWINRHRKVILIILALLIVPINLLILKALKSIGYGRILLASVKAGFSTIDLLKNTVSVYGKSYLIELTGEFGWLDTPVSIIFSIFVLFSMVLVSFFEANENKKQENLFKKWESIYLFFLAVIMCSIIILSMFQWTLYVTGIPNSENLSIMEYISYIKIIPVIGGVQGRYFIPIIPLFLLPLFSTIINKIFSKMNFKFYLLIYYVVVFIYMFIIILNRYWL